MSENVFISLLLFSCVKRIITIIVKHENKMVVKSNHVASWGGNWKIKLSDWPRIWLIFEEQFEPDASPTPKTLRTFNRLCRSLQLLFLKRKREKEISNRMMSIIFGRAFLSPIETTCSKIASRFVSFFFRRHWVDLC